MTAAEKPELTRLFPCGGQIGTSIDVEASGKFASWPIQIACDANGLHWSCSNETGKLKVKVDTDTAPGLYWVRAFNEAGASTARPFLVGSHREVIETEPNNQPKEASAIGALPVSIHGVLGKRGDVDLYSIALKQGESFSASVDAVNWLQSAADITLQVIDMNGFVLNENLDHVGLDPYLEFKATRDGNYCVRVLGFPATPDSTIAFGGGNDWIYRLQLTADSVPFAKTTRYSNQKTIAEPTKDVPTGIHTHYQNALDLTLPVRVAGLISEIKLSNVFRFQANAGKQYRIRCYAREFGSSMDPSISIVDAQGKQLTQVDDVGSARDPELKWKAPADGAYLIEIYDFHRGGGLTYRYTAQIEEYHPEYSASASSDVMDLIVGKETEFTVAIDREPELQDTLQIMLDPKPDSIQCEVVESKHATDSAKKIVLKLTASAPIQQAVRVVVRNPTTSATIDALAPFSKPIWISAVSK